MVEFFLKSGQDSNLLIGCFTLKASIAYTPISITDTLYTYTETIPPPD